MNNLIKIGKFFLILFIATAVFDLAALAYVYTICSRAMEDTLSSIAMIVAEENCIDESKMDSVKTLMVENAPLWLTYNDYGVTKYYKIPSSQVEKPTTIVNGVMDLKEAKENLAVDSEASGYHALTLSSSSSGSNESKYYSYTTCPQRGEEITVTLSANINIRLLMVGNPRFNQQIPISRQVTVVGMKFYKGKDE